MDPRLGNSISEEMRPHGVIFNAMRPYAACTGDYPANHREQAHQDGAIGVLRGLGA